MDEEQLRQIIREEIGKALEGASLTKNYNLTVQQHGQQPLLWPLLALVHKWRIIQTGILRATKENSDSFKSGKARAYSEAAADLEAWITAGKMTLERFKRENPYLPEAYKQRLAYSKSSID